MSRGHKFVHILLFDTFHKNFVNIHLYLSKIFCSNKYKKSKLQVCQEKRKMIIVPPLNTIERAESDLDDLKKIFIRCQELGISQNIEISKYVRKLTEAAGKETFCEIFWDFSTLIEKKSHQIQFIDDKIADSMFPETEN